MTNTETQLASAHCLACDEGLPRLSRRQAEEQLAELSGWRFTAAGTRIRKDWRVENFAAGLEFFARVAEMAEAEGHHPDLHLENYRNVWIELSTHSAGGLTQNDFILAAKIDRLPARLRNEAGHQVPRLPTARGMGGVGPAG
jgi:4a-hydroxytetrahydrobiopterin dehydratase